MKLKTKIPLLVIAGPTASGKSDVAVKLALIFNGEIVSSDSMQVYKYMDIGTAKVSMAIRAQIPHHMLDIVEPDADFSLAQYKEEADKVIKDIWQQGHLPLLVGGTGLYIRAVIENYPLDKLPFDATCRDELNRIWDERGGEYMLAWLEKVDAVTAAKAKDRRRIVRALEVYKLTGMSQTEIHRRGKAESPYAPIILALTLPRPQLYQRIDSRAEEMVTQGLLEEYEDLLKRGYSTGDKAMQGLGYYHAGMHIAGYWSREEMIANLQRDTRRYAKRQLSWFRGMEAVSWVDNSNPPASIERISQLVAGKIQQYSEVLNR
jgi:tRNA dimethylallyltransferase